MLLRDFTCCSLYVGGIPEVVHDGENGFLVEVENHRQMAEKRNILIEDTALRNKFGKAGQKMVSQEYDLIKQVAKLVDYYCKFK